MRASRAFGSLAALALAALAVSAGRAWIGSVDDTEHQRYTRSLQGAQELDARLDEAVSSSRLGLTTHYDDIVRVWDRLRLNREALDAVPRFVAARDRDALLEDVARYGVALEQKRELVERFKTEQAVLRNSLRALPHNAERVNATLRAREGTEALAAEVDGLVTVTLRQVIAPSERQDRAARDALERVERTVIDDDPLLARDVRLVARHARVVLDRSAAVRDVVARIMALRVPTIAGRAQARYGGLYEAASRRTRAWAVAGFVSGLAVLLFGAAFVIARLRRERDREAELAQLKSRFVSMTSHEFRTPLSVILSSAELLEAYGDRWDSDKRAKHIDRITEGAHVMTRMLDQVLLIGRAEAGMLELRPGPVRLPELAEAVVEEARALVGAERALELAVDAADEEVTVDERLLRHVLTNLLSNAFKYSPAESTVRFAVTQNGHGASFVIEDEGIGIPARDRARLFEAFHRCSNAESVPGTGLGLAVVKKSLEVHRGTIDVESEEGRGTRFSVEVPFLGGNS